jgi:hypothetical protein
MVGRYLDSFKQQIEYVKERLVDLRSSHAMDHERIAENDAAEERISALEGILSVWKKVDADGP